MKMTQADYQALVELLAKYQCLPVTVNPWNHLYACAPKARQAWFDRGIYDYLDDTHIHTALKRAINELN